MLNLITVFAHVNEKYNRKDKLKAFLAKIKRYWVTHRTIREAENEIEEALELIKAVVAESYAELYAEPDDDEELPF